MKTKNIFKHIGIAAFAIMVEGTKRSVYLRESPKMAEEPRIEIVR